MSHDFRSARYLDDPFKPVLGLSIPQALALGVAIGVATLTWNLLGARLGDAAITSPLGELRLIVVGAPCAVMYGVVHMLTGGRTEQPLQQAWGYLHRRHRYEPRPLPALRPESLTTQEVHHDRAALPAPAARRRPAVHLPSIHLRVPRIRLALPGLRLPGIPRRRTRDARSGAGACHDCSLATASTCCPARRPGSFRAFASPPTACSPCPAVSRACCWRC